MPPTPPSKSKGTAHACKCGCLGQISQSTHNTRKHLVDLHVATCVVLLRSPPVGTVGLHGDLTSMAWNILRSSSRSSVPLKLKEKQSVLLEEVSFFACSSRVCRNIRLGSLLEILALFAVYLFMFTDCY